MTLDLILRGGTVVDGTGAPARSADVGIVDGNIAEVGRISGTAKREIDAQGLLVTPGFVDMHAHYDGQVTWDPYIEPSTGHGVTTVVNGNCGVGFAPCKKEHRDWLINVMEGVEDIPGSALSEGMQWAWETFEEYLDALDGKPFIADVGTQIPHSALRGYVMGPGRAETEAAATDDELQAMQAHVRAALRAGALGFSTSRTPLHKTAEGVLVAGTHAVEAELYAIARAMKEEGLGLFEISADNFQIDAEALWLERLAKEVGVRVLFNLTQVDQNPMAYSRVLPVLERAAKEGTPLTAQVAGRSIGICMCFRGTAHPFALRPSWQALAQKPWEEQLATLRDPSFRAKLLAEEPMFVGEFEAFVTGSFHKMFAMDDSFDYEPDPSQSLAARAEREGRTAAELAYDALMEGDGTGMVYFPLFNYTDGSLDPLHKLHAHPNTRMGLADGGAHCGAICDAGMPTFMLTHWTRDRKRGDKLPLEYVVHRQTQQTAELFGLGDRGVLAPGYRADVNVIDYDALRLGRAHMRYDLPAGGRRLYQDATGYKFTILRGEIVRQDGEITGALPGRLIRGPQARPASSRSTSMATASAHVTR